MGTDRVACCVQVVFKNNDLRMLTATNNFTSMAVGFTTIQVSLHSVISHAPFDRVAFDAVESPAFRRGAGGLLAGGLGGGIPNGLLRRQEHRGSSTAVLCASDVFIPL